MVLTTIPEHVANIERLFIATDLLCQGESGPTPPVPDQ
jgi:hypothetical protein